MYYLCSKNKGTDQLHGYVGKAGFLIFEIHQLFSIGKDQKVYKWYKNILYHGSRLKAKNVAKSVFNLKFLICLTCFLMLSLETLSRVMRKPAFAYAKTKTQISFAVTAKLISVFFFRYIDSTIPLLPTYKISSL